MLRHLSVHKALSDYDLELWALIREVILIVDVILTEKFNLGSIVSVCVCVCVCTCVHMCVNQPNNYNHLLHS